ncbi:protein artichoke-like [Microplitis mediator]|uniref:protein artichoke-like n=1 Tax=Microplitis mediator TaxID=375433 RepID=UPI002554926C|nr:protein artichoke-like [Microplitis mediator]
MFLCNGLFPIIFCFILVHCDFALTQNFDNGSSEDQNVKEETVLDLSNTGILHLKNPFLKSSVLTEIFLADNNIWKIDNGAFDSLPNLNYLDLSGNLIKFEELNFGEQSKIETLVLDRAIRNQNPDAYPSVFSDECSRVNIYRHASSGRDNIVQFTSSLKLEKLKKLYLRQNNINSINLKNVGLLKEIMPNITHLYLDDNHMSSVDFIKILPATMTHLYLDNNKISKFESASMNSLEFLTINGNRIKNLCGSYGQCEGMKLNSAVNLQTLSVSNVELEEIESDSFENLGNLRYLNISHNKIVKIAKHTFDNLTSLTTLDLDYNRLVTIPDVCGLKNLEFLSLVNNKIKIMDTSSFCGLSKLKKLNLSKNILDEISSKALDSFTALEDLDLSGNKLVVLPDDWISSKLNLRSLYLNNNLFTSISSLSLTENENLEFLNIGGNPFKLISIKTLMTFPANTTVDIGFINNVQPAISTTESSLHHNCETCKRHCYPFSLPNLVYVNLSRNSLSSGDFPFGLINCTNQSAIETLVLDNVYSNSYVTITLTDSIKLLKLKKLYLRQNDIENIIFDSVRLGDIMPNIAHLYLNDNILTSLSSLKYLPMTLTHLHLDNNRISKLEIEYFNNLRVLTINKNNIKNLCTIYINCNGISLASAVNLEFLSISNSELQGIDSNSFRDLTNLRHLDLSFNILREMPVVLRYLVNLKTLLLNNNQIETIPDISVIVSLEHFSIANNKIGSMDCSTFSGLSNLKKLNLSNNALSKFVSGSLDDLILLEELDFLADLSLTEAKNLTYLNIGGNPLTLINIKSLKFLPENTTVDIESRSLDCFIYQYRCQNYYGFKMFVSNVLILISLCADLVQCGLYLRPYNPCEPQTVYISSCENTTPEVKKADREESVLDLSKTGIVRLKKSFLNSSILTHIYLTDNNIWDIEKSAFDSLPNLIYLNLTGNLIKFDQLNFGNQVKIETLVLDKGIRNQDHYDYFYYSDDECSKANTYREKSSNSDNIIELTNSFKLKTLKELYLRKNNIDSIYLNEIKSLGDVMPSISHLYLDDNRLTSVDFIKSLPFSLTHLYLNNNKISKFESGSLNNLRLLTIDGNIIKNMCGSYGHCEGMTLKSAVNLRILSVSNTGLEEIESDSFIDLVNLRDLNLSHNKIIKIIKHTFNYLINLKTLYLDHNKLMTVPDICGLKNLESLTLTHNKIKTIGKSNFCGLSNLKKLNLSNNLLNEIEAESFSNLVALTELDLSGNRLEVLPDDWLSSKLSLQYLYLNNNSFTSIASLSLTGIKNLEFLYIGGNPFKLINTKTLMSFSANTTVDIGEMSSGHSDMFSTGSSSYFSMSLSLLLVYSYLFILLCHYL